jgi:hypothetical protein
VIAVAVTVSTTAPRPSTGSRHHSGGQPAARGFLTAYPGARLPTGPPPRFFLGVTLINRPGADYATVLNVYSSATGRVLSQARQPKAGLYFQAVAALGGQEFLAAATPGSHPRTAHGCDTWLYYLRLNSAGQLTYTRAVASPVPGFIGSSALAASANGQVISYATMSCVSADQLSSGKLTVEHNGGITRTWTFTDPSDPQSMSLSADGSLLVFENNTDHIVPTGDAAYVLRTNAAPGPLAQRWRKVISAVDGVDSAALSPTGAVLFAAVSSVVPDKHLTIGAYDTATGHLVRVIRVFTSVQDGPTGVSVEGSGHFALLYLLTSRDLQRLNLTTGKFLQLPVRGDDYPTSIGW